MGIIYIIVTVLVAALIGYLFIRSTRKKLAAERERKVKVAEGIFEPDPTQKAKRKKKKKRGWLHFSALPELPEWLEEQIQTSLPQNVDEYLKAKKAYATAVQATATAERAFSDACKHTNYIQLPKGDSVSTSFVQTFVTHQLHTIALARAVRSSRVAREKAAEEKRKALGKVTAFITELSKHDTSLITEQDERVLEIARVVTNEDHGTHHTNLLELPAEIHLDAEPKTPNAEADKLIEQLREALAELVSAHTDAENALEQVTAANNLQKQASKHPKYTQPQKPMEDEVSAWMKEAATWASDLQSAHEGLEETLKPLWDALALCDEKLALVRNLCAQVNRLIESATTANRHRERETRLSWAATPFDAEKKEGESKEGESKEGADAGTKPAEATSDKTAVPLDTPRTAGEVGEQATLDKASTFNSWKRRREATPRYEPANLLTDAQQGVRLAAIRLIAKVDPSLEPMKKWPTPSKLFETGELSDADNNLLASAHGAVRKLGYAIAQWNAAKVKLANAEAETVDAVESTDSTIEEVNAEAFIRGHRRYRNDVERRDQRSKERRQRIDAVRAQYGERWDQVTQASATVSECILAITKDRTVLPKLLDAAVKMGSSVCQSVAPKTP